MPRIASSPLRIWTFRAGQANAPNDSYSNDTGPFIRHSITFCFTWSSYWFFKVDIISIIVWQMRKQAQRGKDVCPRSHSPWQRTKKPETDPIKSCLLSKSIKRDVTYKKSFMVDSSWKGRWNKRPPTWQSLQDRLVCRWRSNKLPKNAWLRTTQIYYLQVLEVRSPESISLG